MLTTFNLRPSSIGGFHDCAFRFFNIHLLGIRSWSGYAAVRGTAVHKGAEVIWKEAIKAGEKKFSLTTAKDAAAQAVEEEVTNDEREVRFFDFETKEGAIDDAVKGVEVYARDITPEVEIPAKVETYLKAKIDDDITINGTFDAFTSDGTIVDIKTTGRKAVPAKYIDQMSVYARLAQANGLEPNMKYQIQNVVFLKNDTVAHLFEREVDIPSAQRKIDDIVKRVKWYKKHPDDGHIAFPANPNSYLCSEKYCPVFDTCYIRNDVPF